MNTAHGTFFDGQTARGHVVSLEFGDDAVLRIRGDGIAEDVALSSVRVSDRLGDVPRFLYLPRDASVETPDNASVDAALGARRESRGAQLIHFLESQQRIAAVACALLIAAVVALGFYGPPALARVVAKRVSPDIDQRIGAAALVSIKPYFGESSLTPEDRRRVEAQLARLQTSPSMPRARLEFRSMNGRLPNAFALPGNIIIVTDELVRLPATNNEIAAVLAHELGHLEQRHGLQSLLRKSFAVLIVAAVTGDLSALTSFASTIPLTILTAGYSRDLEREADRYAVALLRERNIDARAFATVLAKLDTAYATLKRNSTYVNTHPATEERIALFGEMSPAERAAGLAESWLEQAGAAAQEGQHALAVTHLGRALELAPSAQAYLLRARSHIAQRAYTAAQTDLAEALKLEPQSLDALVTRAEVLALHQRKHDDGILAANEALALDPRNARALTARGYAEMRLGQREAAAATFESALAADPAHAPAWQYRGQLRRATDPAGALADFTEALRLDPTRESLYVSRGALHNRERNHPLALADFAAVKNSALWTSTFYFERGIAHQSTGKIDDAIADYTKALAKNTPSSLRVPLRLNRATAFGSKGNHRSALADLDAVLDADPRNASAFMMRAVTQRRMGDPDKSLADIQRALDSGMEESRVWHERGNVYWDLERYDDAFRDFDRAVEVRSTLSNRRARGLIHFSLGRWEQAEADLGAVVAESKRDGVEYAEFFRLLARRRGKLEDHAADFAATVAKWRPGWGRSVGEYLTGELGELQFLAEAGAGRTPPPAERRCEAYFYIGQTRLLAGDVAEAERFFDACIATGASHYFEYKLARAELKRLRARP